MLTAGAQPPTELEDTLNVADELPDDAIATLEHSYG